MLTLIIEKEIRDLVSTARFAVTFGICSLLILLTFYVGARTYALQTEQYEAARKEQLRQLEGVTDWSSVRSARVFLPPQPLAALVTGISNDIGRNAEVRGRGEANPQDSRYAEDPIYAVFRFLDLDFLFQILLSLFAILFGYDAVCGEKERGTLRLTFAQAVPRSTYILGKLVGSFVALGIPLLVPLLIGCAILPMLGVPLSAEEWLRLAFIVASGLLFFGVFLNCSILVSALTHRSSNAFLAMLVVWIMAIIVVPRTAVVIAGRAVDVPTVDELASKKSRYSAQLFAEDRMAMGKFVPSNPTGPQVMQEFNKFMSKIADERQKKMDEFSSRLNEERVNMQRIQEDLAFGIARISPVASLSLGLADLANSGLDLKEEFQSSIQRYQRSYGEFMVKKTGMNPGGGMIMRITDDSDREKPKPIDPSELPVFVFQPETLSASLASALPDLGLLAALATVLFLAATMAFLRYDVR